MSKKYYLEQELENMVQTDPNFWAFLQQGSLDGVWYWDLEKPDNEWMSPEFWRLFGVDPDTKKHDPAEWQDIIHPRDLEVALENFNKHCADPSHPYDQIVRYKHADGSTVWVRCRGMAIRNEQGVPIRMLGAHNDLTQLQLQAELARRQIQEKAAVAREKKAVELINEELRTFAYSVSHELKSPTNSTLILLKEVLEHSDADLGPESRELLGMAQNSLENMGHLIEELLRYTRVIGEELTFEEVDLQKLAKSVVAEQQKQIAEIGAKITIRDLPTIKGHPVQLRTLFSNLISNALNYRDPNRPCEIMLDCHAHSDASMVMLRVKDNGIGVHDDNRTKIFAMFNRLHLARDIPGTGLGLALCNRIAANHNGEIFVATPDDHEGSVFCVVLSKDP